MIMDFSDFGGGTQVACTMALAGMYANKNTIPNEPYSPFYPSGVRLGTPAVTTIGMKEKDMEKIADWIAQVVEVVQPFAMPKEKEQRGEFVKKLRAEMEKSATLRTIKSKVKAFLSKSF